MELVKATLIKRKTFNGFWEVGDDVPIGKEYMVYPASISVIKAYNIPFKKFHKVVMIKCSDGVLFPLELLKLEQEEN